MGVVLTPLLVLPLLEGAVLLPLGVAHVGVLHLKPACDDAFHQQALDRGRVRPRQFGAQQFSPLPAILLQLDAML